MANARERAKTKKERFDDFYRRRIDAAPTLTEKLEVAFGKLRAVLANTDDDEQALKVGVKLIDHILAESDKIPRKGAS